MDGLLGAACFNKSNFSETKSERITVRIGELMILYRNYR